MKSTSKITKMMKLRYSGLLGKVVCAIGVVLLVLAGGSTVAVHADTPEYHWTQLKGIANVDLPDIDVNSANPAQLYAIVPQEGLLKSVDAGQTWHIVGFSGVNIDRGSVATHPTDPNVVLVAAGEGIWKSTDGGATWPLVYSSGGGGAGGLAFQPLDPSKAFAVTADWRGGILKSMNSGSSWSIPQSNYIYPHEYAFHPTDPNRIWVGYGRYNGGPINNLGIAYSTNGGSTWSRVEFGWGYGIMSLVVDPNNPTTLYAASIQGTYGGVDYTGVWKSTNSAMSWVKKNSGLINTHVSKLVFDRISGSLYAATEQGVFISKDGAESWTSISPISELPYQNVSTLALTPDGTRLYAGTNGGIYVYAPVEVSVNHITASASSGGSITPSGAVVVNYGANQAFTIGANTGYHIADVLVDGSSVGAVASYTFTNVIANHTIAASFAINTSYFQEDFSTPQLDPPWQVVQTVPGLGRYSLTDNPGYLRYYLEGWLGYAGGWSNGYQNLPSGWRPSLTLIRPFDGENWSLRTKVNYNLHAHIGGSSTGGQGPNLQIAFGEDMNDYLYIYRAVDWWYSNNSLTMELVSNGVAVAHFDGAPSPIGGDGWVRETYWYEITRIGREITVRFSNDGINYTTAFSALLTEPVTTTQRAIIDMILWNGAGSYVDWDYIYVEPEIQNQYTLTVNTTGQGSVTKTPDQSTYADGTVVTLTATPTADWSFSSWSGDLSGNTNPTTITMNGNKTATASFAINTYTINATAGAGGSISPFGAVVVNHGTSQTFTINPSTGYHIAGVLVDGSSVGAVTSYIFSNVTANHSIAVTFAINTYTITASAGAGGSINPSGAVVANHGVNQTFTITPNTGYHINTLTVDGSAVAPPVSSYTFSNVTANHSIAVTFAINTYTITASAGAGGSINPSGAVVANHGVNQTFTITPNTGYSIADVLVDGSSVGAVTSYTFPGVVVNHTIAASFQTPAQATQSIISEVQDLNLPSGEENSLASKLESAIASLENGQENAAVNKLNAFINQVKALSGKKIDVDDAQQLINAAEKIIAFLGR